MKPSRLRLPIFCSIWLCACAALADAGISQKQIAVKAFKDHASVTRIIENLVGRKILHRDFHADDRRRFHLSITDLGLRIIGGMKPVIEANRKKAMAGISAGEIEMLKKVLERITDNCLKNNKG